MPTKYRPSDPSHPEPTRVQTHFWLTDTDLELFDSWLFQLRRSWRWASRSAFARALIALVRGLEIGLHGMTSEAELTSRIKVALERSRGD